jgi:hypothetical protein
MAVTMSTSEILEHMRSGATLRRGIGDRIELRIPNKGLVIVPTQILDALIDQDKIRVLPGGNFQLVSN